MIIDYWWAGLVGKTPLRSRWWKQGQILSDPVEFKPHPTPQHAIDFRTS